jgi:hypothetical protein
MIAVYFEWPVPLTIAALTLIGIAFYYWKTRRK